jgi:hypothetical protein
MSKLELSRAPRPADHQAVKEFFYAAPLIERGQPLLAEMLWVLLERQDAATHEKILPDYCYNIFEVFQKTYFKGFPLFSETVTVTNQADLKSAKTIEQAKAVLQMNWKNLGRMFGIMARCCQFAGLEAEAELAGDNDEELSPAKTEELFTIIFGRSWVKKNSALIKRGTVSEKISTALDQFCTPMLANLETNVAQLSGLAFQWGPAAMQDFFAGLSEGMTVFINPDGRMAGESNRASTYAFLLLAWPEIKVMLKAKPKKTLPDLHEWMLPFMRVGITTHLDIEPLRDVCAPPSQYGIGLSLRPLKSRARRSSP